MSDLMDAALRYASRGWSVFPCHPRSKVPATRNGLHAGTTDISAVRGHWRSMPDANVAIRTGAPSGLVVLDMDGADGHESLREL